jgi:hypothetical protein
MLRIFAILVLAVAASALAPMAGCAASRPAVSRAAVEMGAKKGVANPALFSSGIDPKVVAKVEAKKKAVR